MELFGVMNIFLTIIETVKNAVFWDVTPCSFCVNRRSEDRIASSHY
jgi:hypothetical protein